MKPSIRLSELALQLQEARRRNPQAYLWFGIEAGIPEERVKKIAYGAEPTMREKAILEGLARG